MQFTPIKQRQILTPVVTAIALSITACGGQTDSAQSSSLGNELAGFDRQPIRQPIREARVVGGTEVTGDRYPWMAALIQGDEPDPSAGQFCGGSLIAARWILTAAHCLETEDGQDVSANEISVLLGQSNLTESGGEIINVSRVIEHPDYKSVGYPDLALLELSADSRMQTIQLPSRNNPVPAVGESATVIGWGQISETGPATNELRQTTLPVVDHDQCDRAYDGDIVEDAMVCAGSADGSKDSCYGDSGGPLFVTRGDAFVQAGVVSFGEECGLPGVPGVYARVSSYHDWIAGYALVNNFQQTTEAPLQAVSNAPTVEPISSSIVVSCEGLVCALSSNHDDATDFFWDFGDGYVDEGRSVEYQYDEAGTYTILLGVISGDGSYSETETEVSVTANSEDVTDSI